MPLMEKWLYAPKLRHNRAFATLCRILRVSKLLLKLHRYSVNLILMRKFGRNVCHTRTGHITVEGASFSFHDPGLGYLKLYATGGQYEPAITSHLKQIITGQTSCFIDVGAHYGFYTAYVGSLNPETVIHAFEPNAKSFRVTKHNVSINHIAARTYQLALSDDKGRIPFSGRSMKASNKKKLESVNSITFDELADKCGIKPDVVKVDVHGGEGKVLFGMKQALLRDVKHLYLELHPNELLVDYSMKDIIELILNSGFTLQEISHFREKGEIAISELSNQTYSNLTNQDRWTHKEILNRRMIYAHK